MFIKLTGGENQETVFINVSDVVFLDRQQDNTTHIQFRLQQAGIRVTETPEQIMEMIENARN